MYPTALVQRIAEALIARGLILTTAESCTGGGIGAAITCIPGSSTWYDGGYITYSNAAKQAMLGVDTATLEHHGAVSVETAAEMAEGALRGGRAQLACSVSGIAGPDGGTPTKPVGTVCFGWAQAGGPTRTHTALLFGDRDAVRRQAVLIALQGIWKMAYEYPG